MRCRSGTVSSTIAVAVPDLRRTASGTRTASEQRTLPLVGFAARAGGGFLRFRFGRRRQLGRRYQQIRRVVLRAIDRGRDLVGLEEIIRRRRDQRRRRLRIDAAAIKPCVVSLWV